jgi:flagellar biosynthetic protein FliQ
MTANEVTQIGRELLCTAVLLAAPMVLTSLVVGLLISIFQTVTSIQEQTLTFAPRIIAVALVMLVTLPWTLKVLINFTQRMMERLSQVTL